jgi:cellulose synthase (UDP-forming)
MSREQEYEFVKTTFARADAWTGWAEGRPTDTPLRGLRHVLLVGVGGIGGCSSIFIRLRGTMAEPPVPTSKN